MYGQENTLQVSGQQQSSEIVQLTEKIKNELFSLRDMLHPVMRQSAGIETSGAGLTPVPRMPSLVISELHTILDIIAAIKSDIHI